MSDEHFSPFPSFITDRLILRKLNIDDAENLAIKCSNDLVNQFLNRPKK